MVPFAGRHREPILYLREEIQSDLKAKCGDYKWHLVGDTYDGYKIVANYKGGRFTESLGKSPSKALKNFYMAKQILADKYNIN